LRKGRPNENAGSGSTRASRTGEKQGGVKGGRKTGGREKEVGVIGRKKSTQTCVNWHADAFLIQRVAEDVGEKENDVGVGCSRCGKRRTNQLSERAGGKKVAEHGGLDKKYAARRSAGVKSC